MQCGRLEVKTICKQGIQELRTHELTYGCCYLFLKHIGKKKKKISIFLCWVLQIERKVWWGAHQGGGAHSGNQEAWWGEGANAEFKFVRSTQASQTFLYASLLLLFCSFWIRWPWPELLPNLSSRFRSNFLSFIKYFNLHLPWRFVYTLVMLNYNC